MFILEMFLLEIFKALQYQLNISIKESKENLVLH